MEIGQNTALARIDAIAEIEAGVELLAAAYIPTAARAAIYIRKEAEARTLVAASGTQTTPVAATYPLLAVDAGLAGITLDAAAMAVLAKADSWAMIARDLEQFRRGLKMQIEAAQTYQDIQDILATAMEAITTL